MVIGEKEGLEQGNTAAAIDLLWDALQAVDRYGSIYKRWRKIRLKVVKQEHRVFDGLTIYFWWEIWKERNRRTFQNMEKTISALAYLIKEDVVILSVSSSLL
ncbi:hypothetical protein BS78_09G031200 [Paspalum vaginatum]|nr:hypothetical protein BS78_09G031200 [Paspalum vaginatum]